RARAGRRRARDGARNTTNGGPRRGGSGARSRDPLGRHLLQKGGWSRCDPLRTVSARVRRSAAHPCLDKNLGMAKLLFMAARDVTRTQAVEDYCKAIFTLESRREDPVSTNALAEQLEITAGSVSAM